MITVTNDLFTLNTKNTTYQFKIGDFGYLYHLYYGEKLNNNEDMSYLIVRSEHGFSGVCDDASYQRDVSMDVICQECPSTGVGDFRYSSFGIIHENGSRVIDFRYHSHKILNEKFMIPNMPSFRDGKETLVVTLKDRYSDIFIHLYYSVFEECDIITRSVAIDNKTDNMIAIDKVMSVGYDNFYNKRMDIINFYGAHVRERILDREEIKHKSYNIGSLRGSSSHMQNPFVIICDHDASETYGDCYSYALVYSSNFIFNAEKDTYNQIRISMGINPEGFNVKLDSNEIFYSPEVAMSYSKNGFEVLTNNWHKGIKKHILNQKLTKKYSPILVNNWEATYMDFNEEKLLSLAKTAKSLGIEMLVVDDGWFENRDSDISGLGDWNLNTKKFPNGIESFARKIHNMNMKLGLWFEPEMISESSHLYQEHEDFVLKVPNRKPMRSRYQLVLNLGNDKVVQYLYNKIASIVLEANLDYIKWDMNRSLSDLYDSNLSSDRQGEVAHRYVLGLYKLLNLLTTNFPNLIIEGCSGGGGRFDLGILYYCPQIWTSDNTDAIERLKIQYGTSFVYPFQTMGSHVSVCPNHQTGRITPLHTRALVAYQGTFGYELDLEKLSTLEKEEVKRQIKEFKKYRHIIYEGLFYRLSNPYINDFYTAVQFQTPNRGIVIVTFTKIRVADEKIFIGLRGLKENSYYKVNDNIYTSKQLMVSGIYLKNPIIDYDSILIEIEKIK